MLVNFGCMLFITVAMNGVYGMEDEAVGSARKLDIDVRMKAMIREVLFYCAFLVLLLIVVNGQQDGNSYLQNNNLIQQLTGPDLTNQVGFLLRITELTFI